MGDDGDEDAPNQAYCVSTDRFVNIGHDPSDEEGENGISSGVVTAGFNAALYNNNGSHLGIEALVTDADKRTSLYATSMVMQAQAYNGLWRTVAHGIIDCIGCSSVSFAPFPVSAQRVKVDVVLPAESPTGLLWLASYSY